MCIFPCKAVFGGAEWPRKVKEQTNGLSEFEKEN
jgi:hypothetical protein